MEYLYEGMTIYHLGYLVKKNLLSVEMKDLGILPYLPEADLVIESYLREQEGILTSGGELTPAAEELFGTFLGYEECFSGMLILDSFKQEIILDIDEELVDAEMDVSIPSTPRVFFKACAKNGKVGFAVRSGDGISITTMQSPRGTRHAVASMLLNLCDPQHAFSSPKTLKAVSQSQISKVLDGDGMDGFFKRQTIAHAVIVRSTASDNVSTRSASFMFKEGGHACCIASGVYLDRSTRSWFFEWSKDGIEETLGLLADAPIRNRIDNA